MIRFCFLESRDRDQDRSIPGGKKGGGGRRGSVGDWDLFMDGPLFKQIPSARNESKKVQQT